MSLKSLWRLHAEKQEVQVVLSAAERAESVAEQARVAAERAARLLFSERQDAASGFFRSLWSLPLARPAHRENKLDALRRVQLPELAKAFAESTPLSLTPYTCGVVLQCRLPAVLPVKGMAAC